MDCGRARGDGVDGPGDVGNDEERCSIDDGACGDRRDLDGTRGVGVAGGLGVCRGEGED